MGLETTCIATLDGVRSEGAAHCGDGEIDFRGTFRLRWKWTELSSVSAANGVLTVSRNGEVAEFHLGELAEKWLHQIKSPKSRLDKLGLKPEHRYAVWGEFDETFSGELKARAGEPSNSKSNDLIFIRLDGPDDLDLIMKARAQIAENGVIWTIWPKGRKEFREGDIRNFALDNGLVDVKVASFSETLSALKLVIPVALRGSVSSQK